MENSSIIYCTAASSSEGQLPYGLDLVGVFLRSAEPSDESIVSLVDDQKLSKSSGKLLVFFPSTEKDQIVTKSIELNSKAVSDEALKEVEDEVALNELLIVRASGILPITIEDALEPALGSAIKNLQEGINGLILKLEDSSFKLKLTTGLKTNCVDLYGEINDAAAREIDEIDGPADLKKKMKDKLTKKRAAEKEPLRFKFESEKGGDIADDLKELSLGSKQSFKINLDVALLVPKLTNLASLASNISASFKKQLDQIKSALLENTKDKTLHLVDVYNFWPSQIIAHFVPAIYPRKLCDEELSEKRKQIHLSYILPLERPLVRRGNSLKDPSPGGQLNNTHEGLAGSGLKGGNQSIVYGTYTYHHYMQDRMDDNGWGCAYRSLQTVVSWFRHQGYTDKQVPSHREIQQTLVDIGDKQPNFVGSRLWIGSQEVSFVLNQLYGITSRIMFVSSGAELAEKGRELAHHFSTQGTPIMIGGGVLAHTIIGIDFNENTGGIRFLILDPHYTGTEDLATIQKKVNKFMHSNLKAEL